MSSKSEFPLTDTTLTVGMPANESALFAYLAANSLQRQFYSNGVDRLAVLHYDYNADHIGPLLLGELEELLLELQQHHGDESTAVLLGKEWADLLFFLIAYLIANDIHFSFDELRAKIGRRKVGHGIEDALIKKIGPDGKETFNLTGKITALTQELVHSFTKKGVVNTISHVRLCEEMLLEILSLVPKLPMIDPLTAYQLVLGKNTPRLRTDEEIGEELSQTKLGTAGAEVFSQVDLMLTFMKILRRFTGNSAHGSPDKIFIPFLPLLRVRGKNEKVLEQLRYLLQQEPLRSFCALFSTVSKWNDDKHVIIERMRGVTNQETIALELGKLQILEIEIRKHEPRLQQLWIKTEKFLVTAIPAALYRLGDNSIPHKNVLINPTKARGSSAEGQGKSSDAEGQEHLYAVRRQIIEMFLDLLGEVLPETARHTVRVMRLTKAFVPIYNQAREQLELQLSKKHVLGAGYPRIDADVAELFACVHDGGKMFNLEMRNLALRTDEFLRHDHEQMRKHAPYGARLVGGGQAQGLNNEQMAKLADIHTLLQQLPVTELRRIQHAVEAHHTNFRQLTEVEIRAIFQSDGVTIPFEVDHPLILLREFAGGAMHSIEGEFIDVLDRILRMYDFFDARTSRKDRIGESTVHSFADVLGVMRLPANIWKFDPILFELFCSFVEGEAGQLLLQELYPNRFPAAEVA